MKKSSKSQQQIVLNKLEKGGITNRWAFEHNIWRLGARIGELRQTGLNIVTEYRNKVGERNTKYTLVKWTPT